MQIISHARGKKYFKNTRKKQNFNIVQGKALNPFSIAIDTFILLSH